MMYVFTDIPTHFQLFYVERRKNALTFFPVLIEKLIELVEYVLAFYLLFAGLLLSAASSLYI